MEAKKISLPFVCEKMPENIYSLGDKIFSLKCAKIIIIEFCSRHPIYFSRSGNNVREGKKDFESLEKNISRIESP